MPSILGPVRYAAVNARLRARLRLLDDRDWDRLLQSADVDGVVDVLRSTGYREALEPAETAGPVQLERRLAARVARDFRLPLAFVRGKPGGLLEWVWRRFEVDNLKTVLRGVERSVDAGRLHEMLVPLGDDSTVDWRGLSQAGSVQAVVEQLEGTFYGQVLDQAMEGYRGDVGLFALEVALDLAWRRRLLRRIEDLGGRDRREARRFLRTRIEVENLSWACRYRRFSRLDPAEILGYTLHRRLRVDDRVVRRVATGADPGSIAHELWGHRVSGLQEAAGGDDADVVVELEQAMTRGLHNEARRVFRSYPFHLGVILAWQTLLEDEVRDVVTVIEGVQAGWPPEQIGRQLIREAP
ncbi:MAG: V0D/AC39 family V-type ATPase subunit [Candidatus Longimicrobiales bacterium M2_2A_002]